MTDETTNAEEFAEDMEVAAKVPVPADVAYAADTMGAPEDAAVVAAGGGTQTQNGEVAGKTPNLPWILIAVLALLLACACFALMGVGGLWVWDQSQPAAPVIIAPPAQEQPAEPAAPVEPAEPAAPVEPAEPAATAAPVEPPPEQPVEPPAGEQPPSAEQLPTEPSAGGLPCAPAAGGLILVPLLVIGKKNGIGRSSNR